MSDLGVVRLLQNPLSQEAPAGHRGDIVLATKAAFTGSAPALMAGPDQLTAAVCDGPPPGPVAAAFARAGVAVHVDGSDEPEP